MAAAAKDYASELLTSADKITIANIRPDKYGDRVLADVTYTKGGRTYSLAKKLKSKNLAVNYHGKAKVYDWCVKRPFWDRLF